MGDLIFFIQYPPESVVSNPYSSYFSLHTLFATSEQYLRYQTPEIEISTRRLLVRSRIPQSDDVPVPGQGGHWGVEGSNGRRSRALRPQV